MPVLLSVLHSFFFLLGACPGSSCAGSFFLCFADTRAATEHVGGSGLGGGNREDESGNSETCFMGVSSNSEGTDAAQDSRALESEAFAK